MQAQEPKSPEEEPISLTPEPEEAEADLPFLKQEPGLEEEEPEPISLVETAESAAGGLRAIGAASRKLGEHKKDFRRALNVNGTGATRFRLFHSKISVPSLEHMEQQINEWLDGSQIEVKHIGHVIGTMEGKRAEPNLIVLAWY
jgi:hypothetical protein